MFRVTHAYLFLYLGHELLHLHSNYESLKQVVHLPPFLIVSNLITLEVQAVLLLQMVQELLLHQASQAY